MAYVILNMYVWIWEGLKRGDFSPTVSVKTSGPHPPSTSTIIFTTQMGSYHQKKIEQGSRFKTICETVLTRAMRFGLRFGPPFLSAGPLLGSLSGFSTHILKNLHIHWCTFMFIGYEHSYSSESFGSNLLFYSLALIYVWTFAQLFRNVDIRTHFARI